MNQNLLISIPQFLSRILKHTQSQNFNVAKAPEENMQNPEINPQHQPGKINETVDPT